MSSSCSPLRVIEWEETDDGVRAVDDSKRELVVRASEWHTGGAAHEIRHPVDATATGTARSLSLPSSLVTLADADGDAALGDGRRALGDGRHLVSVNASMRAYLRFDGPATVERREARREVSVVFPESRAVTLGFRSVSRAPEETVTVPPTTDGLARAISTFGCAHRTTSPWRTATSRRRHPPQVAFGPETDVPDAVERRMEDTGVEVVVPDHLGMLFVVAPLAFYLSATVRVEPGAVPHVRADEYDLRYDLGDPPRGAPPLLERVFWLDCAARSGDPYATTVEEAAALDALDLDAETLLDAPLAARLCTYVDAPFERVAERFPEWHLSMYVEPSFENARALSFLLDRLSHVYPAETTPLEGRELVARSLDDFYRTAPGPVPTVDMVKPRLQDGRCHGWMAPGTPIDVFKTRPEAYENRLAYLGPDGDDLSVAVVLNDPEMSGEHASVADIYRERAEDVPMDLTLEEGLTREELADLLASPHDFVHYIGHCEVDGLRCADGHLAVSDVPESNAQTFFLNACGSYYEGLDLVTKGSVAGAVTFRKVLDEQAATVGTAFARMLVNGFTIERAIRLARRRIMMGKDYVVVGDGTQVLTQSDPDVPATVEIRPADEGAGEGVTEEAFEVTYDAASPWSHGETYRVLAPPFEAARLAGNETAATLSRAETCDLLERISAPTIYEGEFHWSDDVLARLRE